MRIPDTGVIDTSHCTELPQECRDRVFCAVSAPGPGPPGPEEELPVKGLHLTR